MQSRALMDELGLSQMAGGSAFMTTLPFLYVKTECSSPWENVATRKDLGSRDQPSPDIDHANALTLNFPVSATLKQHTYDHINYPVAGVCYSNTNGLRHLLKFPFAFLLSVPSPALEPKNCWPAFCCCSFHFIECHKNGIIQYIDFWVLLLVLFLLLLLLV